jgi:hypothetical protein
MAPAELQCEVREDGTLSGVVRFVGLSAAALAAILATLGNPEAATLPTAQATARSKAAERQAKYRQSKKAKVETSSRDVSVTPPVMSDVTGHNASITEHNEGITRDASPSRGECARGEGREERENSPSPSPSLFEKEGEGKGEEAKPPASACEAPASAPPPAPPTLPVEAPPSPKTAPPAASPDPRATLAAAGPFGALIASIIPPTPPGVAPASEVSNDGAEPEHNAAVTLVTQVVTLWCQRLGRELQGRDQERAAAAVTACCREHPTATLADYRAAVEWMARAHEHGDPWYAEDPSRQGLPTMCGRRFLEHVRKGRPLLAAAAPASTPRPPPLARPAAHADPPGAPPRVLPASFFGPRQMIVDHQGWRYEFNLANREYHRRGQVAPPAAEQEAKTG